ncbi:expressed tetratricopeptide repeat protein [Nitzschia inconspicua]|uniref:Expressed tetratricopeptide repeat protein n=1 Tax=Nitzschia inconspicua TaxID=303405 RepID=A0A9K3Q7Z6_9STRA|nr:expressed tetratricopeptide repeat protein [Nitzschia inconspicua]
MMNRSMSSATRTVALTSTETTKAMHLVSHQNNEGVSLYNQGRYSEALQCFEDATRASRTFLSRPLEEEESTIDVVGDLCVTLQVLPSQTTATKLTEIHPSIDPSIYSRPFEIVITLVVGNHEAAHKQQMMQGDVIVGEHIYLFAKISTMLIFNLALAHHTIALQSEDNLTKRRDCFSKARDLYNLAYSIPQREQEHEIIDPSLFPLFVQSILNNLGKCYAFLDDTENSVKCFELLLESICLFQQDCGRDCNSVELKDNFCNDNFSTLFFNNTLFLILKDPGFAPAA